MIWCTTGMAEQTERFNELVLLADASIPSTKCSEPRRPRVYATTSTRTRSIAILPPSAASHAAGLLSLLFRDQGFAGNRGDYYDPRNSFPKGADRGSAFDHGVVHVMEVGPASVCPSTVWLRPFLVGQDRSHTFVDASVVACGVSKGVSSLFHRLQGAGPNSRSRVLVADRARRDRHKSAGNLARLLERRDRLRSWG